MFLETPDFCFLAESSVVSFSKPNAYTFFMPHQSWAYFSLNLSISQIELSFSLSLFHHLLINEDWALSHFREKVTINQFTDACVYLLKSLVSPAKASTLPNASFSSHCSERARKPAGANEHLSHSSAHVNEKLKPFRAVIENTLESAHKYI